MITAREATGQDVAAIREIFLASYGTEYTDARYYDEAMLTRLVYSESSLLLVADSLRSVLFGSGDPAYWPRARRMFATLEEAVRRYPADPSVWYNLAEAYHHFGLGPGLDVPIERTRLTFDRAMPFQVGGDAEGYREEVVLGADPVPVEMLDFKATAKA